MRLLRFRYPRDKLHEWRDIAQTGVNLEASSWENIRPNRLLKVTFFVFTSFYVGAYFLLANIVVIVTANRRSISACIGNGHKSAQVNF